MIENTHLDSDEFCQVLDRIFGKRLALSLKNKIESEIKGQQEGEFTQTFELFYLLMVFKIGLPEFIDKLNVQSLCVLQNMQDLKFKALIKFAESTNSFLAKLRNLVFSNSSSL